MPTFEVPMRTAEDVAQEKLKAKEDNLFEPKPIEEVEPAVTELEDGSEEYDFSGDELDEEQQFQIAFEAGDHYANLAEFVDDDYLDTLAVDLLDQVDVDDQSRKEWIHILSRGMEELGLKIEDTTVPFQGACTATHPLLLEAITKFQSKALAELFPAKGPVETKTLGIQDEQVLQQAKRVKHFMNYEVQHLMPEYGPELDKGLFYVAFEGSGFKKTYIDPVLRRPCSRFVRASDFIISYWASDLETAERYTHRFELTANDLRKSTKNGFFRETDVGIPGDPETNQFDEDVDEVEGRGKPGPSNDEVHTIYEVHTVLDLEGFEDMDDMGQTGIALPYVICIEKDTQRILSIRRNWQQDDRDKTKLMHFTHYVFIRGLGFYGYGYLHLIGSLAKTATSSLRQLVDAGQFATLPAGFKTHGIRVSGDQAPIMPGEFRDVQAPTGDLQKSIIPLPFKEPSATLFNLLQFIVRSAEKFADSTEQLLSEAKNYGPVGTTMALLEQGGKMYSAIHKRLHLAQAQDFKILARLNYEWMPDVYPYRLHSQTQNALRRDFDGRIDVIPVSDPNMPTQAHRISKAQAIFAIAAQAPQEHDMRTVIREQYIALGEEDPDKYMKKQAQAQPLDPITENINIMTMQPVKAGPAQLHLAHVKAHNLFLQMPQVQKNPLALQAGMAHIFEHVALEYRLRIQKLLGTQLPPPGQPLPPEMEEAVALASVEATETLLQEDIMQEVMNDPNSVVAMQGLEVEREKNMLKMMGDSKRMDLDREKMLRDDANKDMDRWVKISELDLDITKHENELEFKEEDSKRNARAKLNPATSK